MAKPHTTALIATGILFAAPFLTAQVTLDGQTAFLNANASTTDNNGAYYETGLSVLGSYTGPVYVISSFSAEKNNSARAVTADFRLSTGSEVHTRFIDKNSGAAGAGSALGIVNVSDNAVTLQHAVTSTTQTNLITLAGSTLSAIPLTSGSTTLSHDATALTAGVSTSSPLYSEVVSTSTGVTVPAVHTGTKELFVSAAFDVTASAPGQGSWKLQVKPVSGGTWQDAGKMAQRTVNANEGIVTLVGLADVSTAGDYQVRLVQASDTGVILTTSDVDLAAISLSIDANYYLPTYETSFNGTDRTISMAVDVPVDMEVFAVANVTANVTPGQSDTGTYSLSAIDSSGTTLLATSTREVTSDSLGSLGLNSVTSITAADAAFLELTVTGTDLGFSENSNFVAIGLTAVPEPGTYAFIAGLAGLLVALGRRRIA